MALTEGMREQIAKDSGVRDPFAKGDKAAAKIIATMAELGLTGGVIGAGGKLVYKGIKGARAMAEARKAINAAKKLKQAKGTRVTKVKSADDVAVSRLSPKTKPSATQQTATKSKAKEGKPRVRVTEGNKPRPKTENKVKTNKQLSAAVKKKSASRTPKPKVSTLTKIAAGTATVLGGAAAVDRATRKKDEAKAETKSPRKSVVGVGQIGPDKSKRKPVATVKKSSKRKPTTRTDKEIAAKMLTRKSKPKAAGSTPDKAKDTAPIKRTNISASKNTGFGPKGNIFPSNAAARKRLMAKYGGTGSAAAKAAARGTQGNLKKSTKK